MEDKKEHVITLSEADYRLLQAALLTAQDNQEVSEDARKAYADLGWAIHYQTQY